MRISELKWRLGVALVLAATLALVLFASLSGDAEGAVSDADAFAYDIANAPGGGLVAAGSAESFEADALQAAVASYKPDGSPDTSFSLNGRALVDFGASDFSTASAVAVESSGAIVLAGTGGRQGVPLPNFENFGIARLLPNGMPDPSFAGVGSTTIQFGADDAVDGKGLAVLPDGRIMLAGTTSSQSKYRIALARLKPDGTPDPSFGTQGKSVSPRVSKKGAGERATALELLPNGRALVASDPDPLGSGKTDGFQVSRYASDGSLDRSFGKRGRAFAAIKRHFDAIPRGIATTSKGRFLVAGTATRCSDGCFDEVIDLAVVRFRRSGRLDKSFGKRGRKVLKFGNTHNSGLYSADVAMVGKRAVVVGTNSGGDRFALGLLKKGGKLDRRFGKKGKQKTKIGPSARAAAVTVDPGGLIVAAGGTDGSENQPRLSRFAVARYTAKGKLDPTFNDAGTATTGFATEFP